MKKHDEIEENKRLRYQIMVVRVARHLSLSKAETFEELPHTVKEHLTALRYCELIDPLLRADRLNGLSLRALAVRYGLSKTTISYHLSKKRPND